MSFATDSEWERPYDDSAEREAQRLQAENAALARETAAFRWLAARIEAGHVDVSRGVAHPVAMLDQRTAEIHCGDTLLEVCEKAMAMDRLNVEAAVHADPAGWADQETHAQHYGLDGLDEMAAESEEAR